MGEVKILVIEPEDGVVEYVDASGRLRRFCVVNGRLVACS